MKIKGGKVQNENMILISADDSYVQAVSLKRRKLSELQAEQRSKPSLAGAVFKARIVKKYPGLKACFVDIGEEESAFLYMGRPRQVKEDDLESAQKPLSFKDLKQGQYLPVQVIKDSMKGKNLRVSLRLSLAGRCLVYLPGQSFYIGLSRQIKEQREELKKSISKWNKDKSLILRTLGASAQQKDLKKEWKFLQNQWVDVQKKLKKAKKPGLIYRPPTLPQRFLRDFLTEEVEKVWVDDKDIYNELAKFLKDFAPGFKKKLSLYSGPVSLLQLYDLDKAIDNLLWKKIWLKSGGFIVIEETEAGVVVDVNTGRFIGKKNQEDNIFKTNLEAAKEIALQLRLRNCGGIILIDFIDMAKEEFQEKLLQSFEKELAKDRVYTQLFSMSELGVAQMTRKKERPSLREIFCKPCEHCQGQAFVKKI